MTIPKTPSIRMTGPERVGMQFPEDAREFFDFFAKRMGERFLHHQLTDRLVESVKMEGLQLLSVANDVYHLGCRSGFWAVAVVRDPHDPSSIKIDPRPEVLVGHDVETYEHEQGGIVAKTSSHFVRADSALEALAGLGRLIEARDIPFPTYEEKVREIAGSFDPNTNFTCTCGTGRGCVIHD